MRMVMFFPLIKNQEKEIRLLGIGAQTQYQSDTVTVTLRTVSVNTGEVLTTVTVTKTVLSYMDKLGVLKFSNKNHHLYILIYFLNLFVILCLMSDIKEQYQTELTELESAMLLPDFWNDKEKAQAAVKEYQDLKAQLEGGGGYDKSDAILTVIAGAGGDDAEDFAGELDKKLGDRCAKRGEAEKENDQLGHETEALFADRCRCLYDADH